MNDKKVIKKENKKFYEKYIVLSPERILQLSLENLKIIYNGYIKAGGEFEYMINSLIKRIDKITESLNSEFGSVRYDMCNNERVEYVMLKLQNIINSEQKKETLDIDADEDKVMKEIFNDWFLTVHCYYYLKLISKNIKSSGNSLNLIKGFIMSAKGFNDFLIKELKSDKIFKGDL